LLTFEAPRIFVQEMNQMFDFYDGGGLDMTFLGTRFNLHFAQPVDAGVVCCFLNTNLLIVFVGAAQISPSGDVNVSRMSKDRLTGPGGFIDISSCTQNVFFMASFTAAGLNVECDSESATLKITREGKVKKFVNEVYEKTFCGDEAVNRGQRVYYVTERAVFRRTRDHPVLELTEIAPGVDLQKDILDQMEFVPAISPDLKVMDQRIFKDEKMNASSDFFGSLEGKIITIGRSFVFPWDSLTFPLFLCLVPERCAYHAADHTVYIDLFGITLNSEDDVRWFTNGLREIFSPLVEGASPPIPNVRKSTLSSFSLLCNCLLQLRERSMRSYPTKVLTWRAPLTICTQRKLMPSKRNCTRLPRGTPDRPFSVHVSRPH
jgi:hypothetical protein